MADNNQLGLFQEAMMQNQQQVDPIQQMAREFSQKNQYFRQLLGDNIIDQGMQQYGPEFFTLLEQQISQNPNLTATLQGSTGQFMPMQNGMQSMNMPAMLNARLGADQEGLRGGVSTMLVQMPDGSYKQMPRMYDAGYNTNAMGGNIDIGANFVPKDGQMPKSMYNIQARYNKKF
jgi:hypothetical protein